MKKLIFQIALILFCYSIGNTQVVNVSPPNGTVICYGDVVSFSFVQSDLVEPVQCLWEYGDGNQGFDCMNSFHQYQTSGNYDVCLTLTDANNTVIQECTSITVSDPLSIEIIDATSPIICGLNDGTISINSTGGAPIAEVNWSNGATTLVNNNLDPGMYQVTITDLNGCTATEEITLDDPCVIPPDTIYVDVPANTSEAVSYAGYEVGTMSNVELGTGGLAGSGAFATWVLDVQAKHIVYNAQISTGSEVDFISIVGSEPNGLTHTLVVIFSIVNTCNSLDNIDTQITEEGCQTGMDGAVVLTPSNLTYEWNDGFVGDVRTNLISGTYMITATDPNNLNCSEVLNVIVPIEDGLTIQVLDESSSTCNSANGSYTFLIEGGSGNYQTEYNGIIDNSNPVTINNLGPGLYPITVTDLLSSCQIDFIIQVMEEIPTSPTVTLLNTPITLVCADNPNGFLEYEIDPPGNYTVTIYDFLSDPVSNGFLSAGDYYIIIDDENGCEVYSNDFEVLNPTPINVQFISLEEFCPGETVSISTVDSYDLYEWSNGQTSPSISIGVEAVYTLTVTTADGCTASNSISITEAQDCVWPGDVNYDGVANNQDLLFIGMSNGNSGQTRDNASLDWIGQLANFQWNGVFSNGINHKHADCDGNGVVELNDTLAIIQNYQLAPHVLRVEQLDGDYDLNMAFDVNEIEYGNYVELQIDLGTEENPIDELYGVAFSIKFNYPEVVNEESIQVDYTNSIFGNEDISIKLVKPLLSPEFGQIDFALTKFDHQPLLNIHGKVLTVRFIIEDNIDGFVDQDYILEPQFGDVLCIKTWGEENILTENNDNLLMKDIDTAVEEVNGISQEIKYYPNPAKDVLYLEFNDQSPIERINVYDVVGRQIFESHDHINKINTSNWSSGIYFLEAWDQNDEKHLIKFIVE